MIEKLKWWFLFCASAAALTGAGVFGLLQGLWHVDQTKLSFVILTVYFVVSGWVGWLTVRAAAWGTFRGAAIRTLQQAEVAKHHHACEEASDLLMKLAIMGTTLGFYLMLSGAFGSGAAPTPAAIGEAAKGLGTICIVTFVGVLCSSLLNLQLVNLRYLTDV